MAGEVPKRCSQTTQLAYKSYYRLSCDAGEFIIYYSKMTYD